MQQTAFLLALSLMFTHELDAIRRNEWRVIPGMNLLSDQTGFVVFVLAHVPLFGLVVWASFLQPSDKAIVFQLGFSAFCVAHVLLHWLFRNNPAYEFNNLLSRFLIWGSGVAGAAFILQAAV